MILAWDSYYLPVWSYVTEDFFMQVSHHSIVSVVTNDFRWLSSARESAVSFGCVTMLPACIGGSDI